MTDKRHEQLIAEAEGRAEPVADVDAEEAAVDEQIAGILDRAQIQTIDGGFPLRFLLRKDGKRILQQMSTIVTYNSDNQPVAQEQVWEDIPEVSEAELEAAN